MQDLTHIYLSQAVVPLAVCLLALYAGAAWLLRPGSAGLPEWVTRSERRQWAAGVLALAALFLAANQMLVRGVTAGIWDADGQFFPYFVLVADHARAGRFVTWDLWTHGGIPLMGDPQVGAFSPINVLFGVVFGGTSLGFRVYWLTIWVLGALGVMALGRHLRTPVWGAVAVALGFAFCGVYLSNAQHTPWLVAYSFVPFVVWRLDVALLSGRWRPAAEAGALWGLSALGGYPGVVVISGCFCALWALGRWAFPEGESHPAGEAARVTTNRVPAGRALGAVALLGVVGVVVLAPTYLAFFGEGAGTQPRVGTLDRDRALSNQLDPGALATLASPYLAILKERHASLWPSSDVSMVNIYLGALAPVLALFAVARRGVGAWRWWLLGLAALSLAAAMGETLPVRGWLYDALPPMRYFRHSAIFRLFFLFAVTVLALYGVRDLAAHLAAASGREVRRFALIAGGVALGAAVAFLPFIGSEWEAGGARGAALLGRAHFAVAWLGIVAVGVAAWRLWEARARRAVPILILLVAGTDALMTATVSVPTVARPGPQAERWRSLDAGHVPDLAGRPDRVASACGWVPGTRRCRRNDQLITKAPVFDAYASERNPQQQALAAHPVALDAATGTDRLWFSAVPTFADPTEEAFEALLARADALGAIPLVVHAPDALLRPDARAEPAAGGRVDEAAAAVPIAYVLRRYEPRRLELDVEAPAEGWLLVTDRWARSWRAEVNGVAVPVHPANFIFRAVPLAPGPNHIAFTFHPRAYPWLVVLSWVTLAVLAGAPLAWRLRRRREHASAPPRRA